MIAVGIDTSLTHTGYAIVKHNGDILQSGVIKSKPVGKKPIDETKRIIKIVDEIKSILETVIIKKPDIVVIEGLAFMARNTTALIQLAGLNYMLRALLVKDACPFLVVAPTTLKKFITGSGRGEKDLMMMKIYKNYGFEAFDNNVSDAFGLAVCGLAVFDKPLKKITKQQNEVIKLLKTQI